MNLDNINKQIDKVTTDMAEHHTKKFTFFRKGISREYCTQIVEIVASTQDEAKEMLKAMEEDTSREGYFNDGQYIDWEFTGNEELLDCDMDEYYCEDENGDEQLFELYETTEEPPPEPVMFSEINEWKEFNSDKGKMELVYMESPQGFHFAIDATYLEQVGEFEMTLPTGEVFNSGKHMVHNE